MIPSESISPESNSTSKHDATKPARWHLALAAMPEPLQLFAVRAPRLARPMVFAWRFGERWGNDHCALMAAAMAFFGLLSLFPILLAGVAVLGKVLAGRPDVIQKFIVFATDFFPGATGEIWQDRVFSEIGGLARASGGWLGALSLASLLWSGRAFFDTLAAVLNNIWPTAIPRSWLQHQMALWLTFVGAAVLYVLSLTAIFAQKILRAINDFLPNLGFNRQPITWDLLAIVFSWALTVVMFWMIYRFLPNAAPGARGRNALGAALVATSALELSKAAFSIYLPDATRYGAIYGGVASVVVTLMWLYLSSSIILLGAEFAAVWVELETPKHNKHNEM